MAWDSLSCHMMVMQLCSSLAEGPSSDVAVTSWSAFIHPHVHQQKQAVTIHASFATLTALHLGLLFEDAWLAGCGARACAKHKRMLHVLTSNRNRRITLHNKSDRVSMPHRICQNVTKTNRSNIQTQAGIRHGCVSLEPQSPCA